MAWYYTNMNTARYQTQLEEEKAKLEVQLARIGRRNPAVPNDWEPAPMEEGAESDPIDQADAIMHRENDVAVFDALEARYDAIVAALARIDAHTYGRCEVCNEPISEARLAASPSATTCATHVH